jgi:hypothetical protein
MAPDEAPDQAHKAVSKKAAPATNEADADRALLKPGEELLSETTQAEIIMGRKWLKENNDKALMREQLERDEAEKQPKNLVLQRSDPRFQEQPQSTLKNPPVQAGRPTSMTR